MEAQVARVPALQGMFSFMLYGAIGFLGPSIIMFANLDAFQDRFTASLDSVDTYDFIVVGGGASGSVVAHRLSDDFRVLLLEAGGLPSPLTEAPTLSFLMLNREGLDWNYRTIPQKKACFGMPKQQCAVPRGKALGGSSNLNFMAYTRGSPHDYDNWANYTRESLWRYNSVVKYFKRSENFIYSGDWDDFVKKYHAKDGPLDVGFPSYTGLARQFVAAGKEMGYPIIDYNAPFHTGFGTLTYLHKKGRRLGTFQAFLQPIRDRKSLTVRKFAHVNKLLIKDNEDHVYGVEYVRHGVKRYAHAKMEVVLCAGAINSPKILMLSGIGPKDHLESLNIKVRKDLPVGKNLQDHVSTFIGPFLIDKAESFNMDRDVNTNTIADFMLEGKGPLTSTGLQATGFITSSRGKRRGEEKWPDLQLILLGASIYNNFGKDSEHAFNSKPGLLQKFYEYGKGTDSFQIINVLSRPIVRGEIRLNSSDPVDNPMIDPKYLENYEDAKTLVESLKLSVQMVENTTTFQKLGARLMPHSLPGCETFKFKSDAYYECFVRSLTVSMHDFAGTCHMSNKDSELAVVDPRLKIIGIKGVRVIDSSIMPFITTGNSLAVSVMIGEIGSDFIKWDYLS